MKSKAAIPLVLGLGMGFLAIKMGISVLRKAQGKPVETANVVVAAAPIEAASAITESMLRIAAVPVSLIPPGSFQDPKKLIGRVPTVPISTGIALSAEMLAPEGAEPGLPSQIPEGYRAISVAVDESTAVAGFVCPGHRVDVYATESLIRNNTSQRAVSRLLLEDVQVGAVGQSIRTVDPDGKTSRLTRSVTLYVRPEDVPALDVAARSSIRLALRGSSDKNKPARTVQSGPSALEQMSALLKDLKSLQPKRPPTPVVQKPEPPPPPKPHVVEVYRGEAVERRAFVEASGGRWQRVDATAVAQPPQQEAPPPAQPAPAESAPRESRE